MPCYSPLDAWRPDPSTGSKKLIFSYNAKRCQSPTPDLQVPCGQCVGCRLERSRQWAVRCVHESKMHKENCFITLTYRDEALPEHNSLDYRDFQLFMKRLRFKFGDGIRFYMCGEYGEQLGRPHYHACIFGFDFKDKKLWKESNGQKLYRSKDLEELWPHGHSSVGSVTFESAAYVARYIMKKITGESASRHYAFRGPYNRGNISPPPGVHYYVTPRGDRLRMVQEIPLRCLSVRSGHPPWQADAPPSFL